MLIQQRMNESFEHLRAISELPAERIDQGVGAYFDDYPCCIGAHLANQLGVAREEDTDYRVGASTWAEQMGGNIAHAIVLLRMAGAVDSTSDPFGASEWEISIAEVCENLKLFEELPSVAGANLSCMPLHYMEMSDTDFSGASFHSSTLYGSKFKDCDLSNTDLSDVDAMDADFENADLTNANMRRSMFHRANFNLATLVGANTRRSDFAEATFEHADVQRKFFEDAGSSTKADKAKICWVDSEGVHYE